LIIALAKIRYGVIANRVTTRNLAKVIEGTSDQVDLAIKDMQRSFSSIACMVMDHCLTLDFLLLLLNKEGYVPLPILPVAHI
jgi:hypothetical protein